MYAIILLEVNMNDKKVLKSKIITLRMPLQVWLDVKAAATEDQRSVTSQIVFILKTWLAERARLSKSEK
jgi:hypothetical protein